MHPPRPSATELEAFDSKRLYADWHDRHHFERALHAVVLRDRNIGSWRQGMSIQLEEWLIIGVILVVIVEAPALSHMTQAPELKLVGAPDTGHFATILDLFPSRSIDMGVLRQGRYEFIAVTGTT